MNDEEKSAAIVRTIFSPSYSHAENILRWFSTLEAEVGTSEAIDVVYGEVVEDGSVSTDGV